MWNKQQTLQKQGMHACKVEYIHFSCYLHFQRAYEITVYSLSSGFERAVVICLWKPYSLLEAGRIGISSLQALPKFQLRNNNKLKKTTMWRYMYFAIRLSVVFFLPCIQIMTCCRIKPLPCKCYKCLWYLALCYFFISTETKMRVRSNVIDYNYVNNFPIFLTNSFSNTGM